MPDPTVAELVLFAAHEPRFEESPIPVEKCVAGRPLQRSWHHYSAPDDRFFAGIWEAEPGRWRIHYTEHEYCRILAGCSRLHDGQGGVLEVKAGDDLVIPAGFKGEWEVLETTRKVYVIYQP